jgi:hypothetical protein
LALLTAAATRSLGLLSLQGAARKAFPTFCYVTYNLGIKSINLNNKKSKFKFIEKLIFKGIKERWGQALYRKSQSLANIWSPSKRCLFQSIQAPKRAII